MYYKTVLYFYFILLLSFKKDFRYLNTETFNFLSSIKKKKNLFYNASVIFLNNFNTSKKKSTHRVTYDTVRPLSTPLGPFASPGTDRSPDHLPPGGGGSVSLAARADREKRRPRTARRSAPGRRRSGTAGDL